MAGGDYTCLLLTSNGEIKVDDLNIKMKSGLIIQALKLQLALLHEATPALQESSIFVHPYIGEITGTSSLTIGSTKILTEWIDYPQQGMRFLIKDVDQTDGKLVYTYYAGLVAHGWINKHQLISEAFVHKYPELSIEQLSQGMFWKTGGSEKNSIETIEFTELDSNDPPHKYTIDLTKRLDEEWGGITDETIDGLLCWLTDHLTNPTELEILASWNPSKIKHTCNWITT